MNHIPTPPPFPPQPPNSPRPSSRRVLLIIGCAIAAIAAVIAANAGTSDDNTSSDAVPADTQNDTLTQCVTSWNTANENKVTIAGIALAGQNTPDPHADVHVDLSSLFPDKCLITVANSATLTAQQYLQESGGTWGFAPAWTGSATQLDSSVTAWNAEMSQDGNIHLN